MTVSKAPAPPSVEKKWASDKWEGPFCCKCRDQRKMRKRNGSSPDRPIFECGEGCGYAAYADDSGLIWTKRTIDFFAINKEFSAR